MFYVTNPSFYISNIQPAEANPLVLCLVNPVDEEKGSLSCPTMYRAVCKPLHRFKAAPEMTVKETSMWIWTIGYTYGWQEAVCYSRSFLENDIAGDMLPELSLHDLEYDLCIRNLSHRLEIKGAIDLLFPNTKNQFRAPAGFVLVENRRGSVVSMDEQVSLSSTMSISSASVDAMSESFMSTSTSSFRDIMKMTSTIPGKKSVSFKSRSLILTVRPEQRVLVGEIEFLKSRFARFNYTVKISPRNKKPGSYIVVFNNDKTACKARAESAAIGYNLTKYRDPRPRPVNLVRFKTLSILTVRDGKSLKNRKLTMLKKNAIVTVNQVKGRRARIIFFQDGEPLTFGWVSLISENGTQLLERLE